MPCLAVAACDRFSDDTPATASVLAEARAADVKAATPSEAKADEAAPSEESKPTADAQPTTTLDIANAAIFVVRDKGVVVLDGKGFTTLPDSANKYVSRLLRGADGKLRAVGFSQVWTLDATGLVEDGPDFGELGSIEAIDVDRKGTIWAVHTKGVSHFADGKWTTDPDSTFGSGQVLLTGVAVDGEDRPWVSTGDKIWHHEGGTWTPVAMPKGPRFLDEAFRGADGAVYVLEMDSVWRTSGATAVTKAKMPKSGYGSFGDIAFSQSGVGVIENDMEACAVFMPADAAARYKAPKDFKIGSISALSVDDRRRVWVAGEGGVAIVGPDNLRVVWRSGSMEPIAGQINDVLVQGNGPELPEAGAVQKGNIAGRIVDGDKGVVGVAIELCENPSMFYTRTPCTGEPTVLRAKTDAEGRFALDGVPLGAYGIAVKIGKKWQITLGSALGSRMKAGETFDIGEIEIAKK
ncbi:MAG TPA: carboxypeptidase-like regulatory domain-containing protein [Nannocystaceae bacterium]|nr:carboxypeptidase-like regulatory domain-containing protein [Nannocystaceae bacterium]